MTVGAHLVSRQKIGEAVSSTHSYERFLTDPSKTVKLCQLHLKNLGIWKPTRAAGASNRRPIDALGAEQPRPARHPRRRITPRRARKRGRSEAKVNIEETPGPIWVTEGFSSIRIKITCMDPTGR